ncbi:NfeD family protein [Amphibacillus sp. MSJ-3]|uniref:NfeD family protein n=1 Tax=Amphibacillus sp. MSJ-3 TaxID=2841505 RepID=UPI001C0F1280|nr:NfeD family protein [Amphibacillus sp. MSJ-3]MBU5595094.1 NfeD family protein [Amphibacillus sp. MSJ-3]
MDIQTIYLYGLIIGGVMTLLYMLFGDVFEGISEITPGCFLNPTVILSFIAVLSGAGYIMELRGSLNSASILVLATLISLVIVSIIHFFILVPLAKSEQSTAISRVDYIGKKGEVIITIPAHGIGEVLIKSGFGSTGNIAKCVSNTGIPQGTLISVIEIDQDGVLIVEPILKK